MKARIILAITEQVTENQYERHYATVDAEIISSKVDETYRRCDIIGGEWLPEEGKENESSISN